jgi:hypothetical protein
MSHTLITIRSQRRFYPESKTYREYAIYSDDETLDSFHKKMIHELKQFNQTNNFKEEMNTIPAQLKKENFAKLTFEDKTSTYHIIIVAPKSMTERN